VLIVRQYFLSARRDNAT